MPNFDLGVSEGFVDTRRSNRIVGVLNGTQTVANQCQINGPNTGYKPVSGIEVGQVVDIISPAGTVRGSVRTVTAISGTTTLTVTYSGADIGTDANGDLVILSEGVSPLGTPGSFDSVAAMDTALTALNGSYFTTARLANMTENDKVYALRVNSSPGGL